MTDEYSQADLDRFQDFKTRTGHTHVMTVERGEISLRRDGPDKTLSQEAVQDMGRAASAWVFSRAVRSMDVGYHPKVIAMLLTVQLNDEEVPTDGEAHFYDPEQPLDALLHVDGHSIIAEFARPPDNSTDRAELERLADGVVEDFEHLTSVWIASRISRAWPTRGAAHRVTMAVKVMFDGVVPETPESLLPSDGVRGIDGSHRSNGQR